MAQVSRRALWDLAILVLGLNLWITLLVLPIGHLEQLPGRPTLLGAGLAVLGLCLGVALRQSWLLLGGYPLLLLVPLFLEPRLVGSDVFEPWAAVLVALSSVAYLVGTLLMTQLLHPPPPAGEERDLEAPPLSSLWRGRLHIYWSMAAVAGIFPAVLMYALFIDREVRADIRLFYPDRANEATTLFGILGLALWLAVFYGHVLSPMRAHVKSDPQMRHELERLRRRTRRGRPGLSFYLSVAFALGLMLALLLARR